jgi:hypothetical protein
VVDREKVLTVLLKRFPDAAANDLAAAANAIVGLEAEYVAVAPAELSRFECCAGHHAYGMRHVANGDLRIFRRKPRT